MVTITSSSLILAGLAALQGGRLHYPNYWGGAVFAPLAIVVGVLGIVIVVAKWRSFSQTTTSVSGKPGRRPRRPIAERPPIETFDKPWNP
jgi:hypothetical protein